jgi:hypothetical protein
MDSNKLKTIALIVVAAFVALYFGIAAATAQVEVIAWVVGGTTLAICLSLGRRIWLLLPLMTQLSLVLPLPGNFSSDFLAQLLIIGFSGMLFLMRKLPMSFKVTELEIWCLLFILCVVQVYLRNPVGINIFGSESIGGRPYVLLAVTFITCTILSVILVNPNDLKWWVRLTLIGAVGNLLIGALMALSPSLGRYLGASFSTDVEQAEKSPEGRATRVSFVRGISRTLALWISSRISPLKACFSPFYAPLLLITLAAGAMSGFRSHIGGILLTFLVGMCYRGGIRSVVVSGFLGAGFVVLLAFVNAIAPLPSNIQRALTFLPGTWDEQHKIDTAGSTEWRVQMWQEALFTDKWIKNKWLGDGLGFTKAEYEIMLAINMGARAGTGTSGLSSGQETMMINGGYHSGPVQTVRTVGYVGLAILLIAFYRMSIHAHRQIQRSKGTVWYVTTLFICIPAITGPISWNLIIGSFDSGAYILLMGCAMIRMLEKCLPLPAWTPPIREPYLLHNHRSRVPTCVTASINNGNT